MTRKTAGLRRVRFAAVLLALVGAARLLSQEPGTDAQGVAPRILKGHGAAVYQVDFAPGGDVLATASFDGSIRLWRSDSGGEIATLRGHGGRVLSLDFSPDARRLASGGDDGTFRIWTVPLSRPTAHRGHGAPITCTSICPDGAWVATGAGDRSIIVRDRTSGSALLTIEGLPAVPVALRFTPDHARLVVLLTDGAAEVRRLPDRASPEIEGEPTELIAAGTEWSHVKGDSAPPADWNSLDFDASSWPRGASGFGYSSNEQELATVRTALTDMRQSYLSIFVRAEFEIEDPGRVVGLELNLLCDDGFVAYLNGQEVGRDNLAGDPPAHDAGATRALEPRSIDVDLGKFAGELRRGKNVLAIQGHNANLTSSDFILTPILRARLRPEPEGAGEAGAGSGALQSRFAPDGSQGTALALTPDGSAAAIARGSGALDIVTVGGGSDPRGFKWPGGPPACLVYLAPDRLAGPAGDKRPGDILVVDTANGSVARSLSGHRDKVLDLAVSRRTGGEDVLASAGQDGQIILWNSKTGSLIRRLTGHTGPVRAIDFLESGSALVSGSDDGSVRIWTVEDGTLAHRLEQKTPVRAVAAVSSDQIFSVGPGNELLEWRIEATGEADTFEGQKGLVHAVAFDPRGGTLATGGSNKLISLWNLSTRSRVRDLQGHEASLYCLDYAPDGSLLASGGYDRIVRLWNPADGSELRKLEGHEEGVFDLAFSEDGRRLLSASPDHTIRIWDVESGETERILRSPPEWIMGVALPGDSDSAVSVGLGGGLVLWNLADGQERARRELGVVVHGLALDRIGGRIATANADGTCFLLDWPTAWPGPGR